MKTWPSCHVESTFAYLKRKPSWQMCLQCWPFCFSRGVPIELVVLPLHFYTAFLLIYTTNTICIHTLFFFCGMGAFFCDFELENCRPSARVIVSSRRMHVVVMACLVSITDGIPPSRGGLLCCGNLVCDPIHGLHESLPAVWVVCATKRDFGGWWYSGVKPLRDCYRELPGSS